MAQRAPLTEAEKQMISQKKGAGESLVQISREMQCSYETVRKWWRMESDQRQPRARGRPKRGPLSTYPVPVSEKAIQLKQDHPHRGPKMVKLELAKVLCLSEKRFPVARAYRFYSNSVVRMRCSRANVAYSRRPTQKFSVCISAGKWMPKRACGWDPSGSTCKRSATFTVG